MKRRGPLLWLLASLFTIVGLVAVGMGIYLGMRNPRTNAEDDAAWYVLAVGASIVGAGVCMPFARPRIVILAALASPVMAFCTAVFVVWALIIANAILGLGL